MRIKKPSPALAISFVALFVALTAGAYAADVVGPDRVVSTSIKDREVKSADIGYNAVGYDHIAGNSVMSEKVMDNNLRSQDILNWSIESVDIARDTLVGSNVKDGTIVEEDLAPGSVGATELDLEPHVVSAQTSNSTHPQKNIEASCPAGETAISGGAEIVGTLSESQQIYRTIPIDADTWRATAEGHTNAQPVWGLKLSVLCVAM